MNNRPLRRGDLCLIVGGNLFGESVELIQKVIDGEEFKTIHGRFAVNLSGKIVWHVFFLNDQIDGHVGERFLRRLGDNPDAETETAGEEEELYAG